MASATDTGSRFITKDHPMVNYIDDVAQNNSYLSTYLVVFYCPFWSEVIFCKLGILAQQQ